MRYILPLVLWWCVTSPDVVAQTKPLTLDDSQKAELAKTYLEEAKSFDIRMKSDSSEPLKLNPKQVFMWINTARIGRRLQHGGVYVWERDGRAEVIATIFTQQMGSRRTSYFEIHSLATELLEAKRQDEVFWTPKSPGVKPRELPKAGAPAKTRGLRKGQMRSLARRFSGHSINYDGKEWSLKLLPNPLHRVGEKHPQVLDGAVFALLSTAGTDPEVLVNIEARKVDGQWKWHYSLCRFTDLRTFIFLDKDQVMKFPGTGDRLPHGPNDIYHLKDYANVFVSE